MHVPARSMLGLHQIYQTRVAIISLASAASPRLASIRTASHPAWEQRMSLMTDHGGEGFPVKHDSHVLARV